MKALKTFFGGVLCLYVSNFADNLPPIDMVFVEGGTFMMGLECDSTELWLYCFDETIHRVTLSGFYIGKYEVTQDLWNAVMGDNPSVFKRDSSTYEGLSAELIAAAEKEVSNLPIENVSWNEVQVFIEKLNEMTGKEYRLPTEAEWEYAARGGKLSKGFKYAGSDTYSTVVASNNIYEGTSPVGTKEPNELGIYDMSGNVWELVHDWYENYSNSAKLNPIGPPSGLERVIRGGSWDNERGSIGIQTTPMNITRIKHTVAVPPNTFIRFISISKDDVL